jgi:hypothetical protein
VNDVCVPTPAEVLDELFADEVIEGEVVDFTGNGATEHGFVVVRVGERAPLLVVPAMKIRVVDPRHG